MKSERNDVYNELKSAGYWLAQKVYESDSQRISELSDLNRKYTSRLLNFIKTCSKIEFLLHLEKIYISVSVQPNKFLIDLLKEQDLQTFREMALAFLFGFQSEKKSEKKSDT